MIVTATTVSHWLLNSTLFSEFFIIGIPLLFVLYFQQIAAPRFRFFWLGLGLGSITAIKYLFLLAPQKTTIPEPYYSLIIFVLIEVAIRWFFRRETDRVKTRENMIIFISGYLFIKAFALGLIQFFNYTVFVSYLTQPQRYAMVDFNAISNLSLYINMSLHSVSIYGYIAMLFFFLLLRTKIGTSKLIGLSQEIFFIGIQFVYLFVSNWSNAIHTPAAIALQLNIGFAIFSILITVCLGFMLRPKRVHD